MRLTVRILAIACLSVLLLSCSSGKDGHNENVPAVEHEGSAVAPATDIEGFMGLMWGDGTDVLLDHSMYDVETLLGNEVYSLKGGTHHLEDYGVDVDYEVYEFVDGELVSGEVGGNNMGHMNKMREYLIREYGQPEAVEGLYTWKSDTGTITLEDNESYWRLIGWSADAPSY